MADKKKQLITNVAVGYILVSAALFAIFIITYRIYWYRIHKQQVIDRARQSEEVSLIRVMRPFLLKKEGWEFAADERNALLTRFGKAMLDDLQDRLKGISVKDPIDHFEGPDPEPTFIETPVETDGEKRLDALLRPVVPQSGDGPFEALLKSVTEKSKGLIEFRVFVNGIEQMVPLYWKFIGSRKMDLRAENGDVLKWDLRAYVVPQKVKKVVLADVEDEMEKLDKRALRRLSIYPFEELTPIFKGEANDFDPTKLDYYETKAEKSGKTTFECPVPLHLRGSHQGVEMTKLKMRSFLSDPELRMTFVMERDIYEYEWNENQFFHRNRLPILTYVVMAWLVCPLVFWVAVRRTNRFQFQFTADLEGEEDPLGPHMAVPGASAPREMDSPSYEAEEEDEEPAPPPPVQKAEPKQDLQKEEPTEPLARDDGAVKKEAAEDTSGSQVKVSPALETPDVSKEGPLTRRLRDPAEMGQPLDHGDVDEIRQNNIRKSSGSFNRRQEDEEDVDYLAGVESDVLKSLIKKLREQ